MPTQIIIVGKSLNAYVGAKFQNCPFQNFGQSGFRMGKKRNMFHFSAMTMVAIQPVNGKFKYNFSAAAERLATNPPNADRFNTY
jgi:hypothetical protein